MSRFWVSSPPDLQQSDETTYKQLIFMSAANPTHEVHRGDIPYQPPFERSASPNDSLTTAYGPDDTNQSDAELSEDGFSNKVLAGLRVSEKREEEERAEARPLIMPRARRGSTTVVNAQTEEKGGWFEPCNAMVAMIDSTLHESDV